MSTKYTADREKIVIAACDVAGRSRPLSSDTPESDRVYLYACPDNEAGQFLVGELSSRLGKAKLEYGVDWNKESQTYGVRFLSKASKMPTELKPFTSKIAQKEWDDWAAREKVLKVSCIEAAKLSVDGDEVKFTSPERAFDGVKFRRSNVERDERG